MKKKFIALFGVALLALTGCSSSSTSEKDVTDLYKNKDTTAYSLSESKYVAKENLESADVWTTSKSIKKDKALLAEYEAKSESLFASIRTQTALGTGVFTNLTSTFALYNALDKSLAEKYGDEVEYLIKNGKATASFEGSHTFTADDSPRFDNGAYAFSYSASYNEAGLLEKASLILSIVQKEGDKDATFMRTYKASAELTWTKA